MTGLWLLARLSLSLALVWCVYFPFTSAARKFADWLLARRPPERISYIDSTKAIVIPTWGVMIAALYAVVLRPITGVPLWRLYVENFRASYVAEGFLLGFAQASICLLLSIYVLRALAPLRSRQVGSDVELEYRLLGQCGWMRTFTVAFRVVPAPWSFVLVATGLMGEEIIFRSTLIPLYSAYGSAFAIAMSTAFFVIPQFFSSAVLVPGRRRGRGRRRDRDLEWHLLCERAESDPGHDCARELPCLSIGAESWPAVTQRCCVNRSTRSVATSGSRRCTDRGFPSTGAIVRCSWFLQR
jgi:hypothetical protein